MVKEDGGCLVVLIGKLAFELHYETWLSHDHLVSKNNLPCLGCLEHLLACVAAFCLPCHLGHGTKEATSTSWQHRFLVSCHFFQLF